MAPREYEINVALGLKVPAQESSFNDFSSSEINETRMVRLVLRPFLTGASFFEAALRSGWSGRDRTIVAPAPFGPGAVVEALNLAAGLFGREREDGGADP